MLIFGAQSVALGTYLAYQLLYPDVVIEGFLVTALNGNPKILCELPVMELSSYSRSLSDDDKQAMKVLIAVPDPVIPEVEQELMSNGWKSVERIDSARFADLMREYFSRTGQFQVVGAETGNVIEEDVRMLEDILRIYVARFHKDKPTKQTVQDLPYMRSIQAGASLCEDRIAPLTDNTRDNISLKNVNYSELTALYWMWKQELESVSACAYYGLAHYRRKLDLSEVEKNPGLLGQYDVILPFPMPYEPDINSHHARYLKPEDWEALCQAVGECSPEYRDAMDEIFNQRWLYNYNIIIAKKDVLRDYCEWLFPILSRVEELSIPKGNKRADRYIGYMGESLLTLYFMHHRNDFKIAHTGIRMLT